MNSETHGRDRDPLTLCAHCGAPLAAADSFCGTCGEPAPASADDEARLARLIARAPQALAEKLRASTSEGKTVTTLCATLSGSDADWRTLADRALDRFAARIYRYEGAIARLVGDGLLAFFGAPITHEDDARRAVHAALELLADARELGLAVRVGVHTGQVIVGASDLKVRDRASGDTVNRAVQLQAVAPPMTVLLSRETYRYVGAFFECADLGTVTLGAKPVEVYEALRARAGNVQGRGIVGLESIFVGRAAELDRLRPLSSAVQAGLGRVALILGEPGLGKSRMLSEWRAGQSLRWIEGQCQSFAQGFPYQLVVALLRSLLGVGEADAEAALKEQTARFFGEGNLDVYPYLANLLGLSLDGAAADRVEQLDPQSLAMQYADAFRRLLAATTAKAPAAVICEDIHWADPSSVELLTKILPMIPVTRVLFCFSSRPERDVPGWRIVTAARELLGDALTEIQLKPLSDADSQQLLSTLLNANALPPQVMDAVRSKAEGNPFFVEELVRTLIEDGTIRHEGGVWVSQKNFTSAHVPDNLSGLLLARIDRQPDAVKQAIRVASVIGRQFSVRVLQQVLGLDDSAELMTRLNTLETASLIQLAQVEPELDYRFRHALLQEASYDSLLPEERQQLHHAVGRALETLYPERLHELAATLGHHFMEAGEQADARKYYLLAAEYAERMYANAEAIAHYSHVLTLLDPADRFRTLRERGALYERVGSFDASRADFEAALENAHQNGDRRGEWQALIDLGALWATNDYLKTGEYYQRAYELAQTLEEPLLVASALNRVGNWHVNREAPGVAIQFHEQALRLFEEQQDQMGILETVDLLGMAEMMSGNFSAAGRHAEQTLALAQALGIKHLQATALSAQAFDAVEVDLAVAPPPRPFEETVALLDESLRIVRSIGWRAYEAFFTGWSALLWGRSGDYRRGLEHAAEGLRIAREIGHQQWQIQAALSFAQIYLDMCAPMSAREMLAPALEQARRINSLYWVRVISAMLALTHVRLGELDQAEALLNDALDFSLPPESFAMRWLWIVRIQLELARDHFEAAIQMLDAMLVVTPSLDERGERGILMMSLVRGKALIGLLRSGKGTPADLAPQAETALRAAETLAQERQILPLLWRANAALGELYRYLMRPEDSEAEFSKARAIVEQIAATAPNDDLRDQLVRGAAEEWSNLRDDLNYRMVKGYQIREMISSGGFGVVYRAYQPVVDREVAVKVIRPQFANQPEFVRRFEAEAHLVARLEHPYIVPLYDYWHDDDGAFLVMRFIRGGSLRDALRGGALPFDQVAEIAAQVAAALAAAHRQGVIHRDIKPDNILLDEDGNAYLTDFGIAKIAGLNRITADEGIAGSLHYVSPEQIMGEAVSPQTDIYGLGVVLYEALVGQHPFADAAPAQLIFRHLETPLPDFSPIAASEVIQKATRKNPAERYASAPEFAQALRAALIGEQRLAAPPSSENQPSLDDETQLGFSPGDAPTT